MLLARRRDVDTSIVRRWPGMLAVLTLGALAYLPSLTAKPGRMPSDTKLYLYLDPGALLSQAATAWDTSQFGGWVPHQLVAYLWPAGPWFWVFETIGVPDWVAHRLWLGTILFLGGLGVRWAARLLGLAPLAALVAAIVYQLSPYVLPYVSRTSIMLLPWAGVGWMVGLTVRACTRSRWRHAALFALVVVTVGAVNATALAVVAPAPALWILHAAWQRVITWRTAAVTAAKLGGLSLLVSIWWIVMLTIQGRHGADVLSFSESLEAVSRTSVSTETLRGLGYWLFYVRDPWGFTTTASVPYLSSGTVIAAGYALVVVGLLGASVVRWAHRRYAALMVFTGIVLAVGVHPIDDPSPLMSPVEGSALGLALRSSTRALPLSTFGLALGAGALVAALADWRPRARLVHRHVGGAAQVVAAAGIVVLSLVQMPAVRTGAFVDPALERDEQPPAGWQQAADALDETSDEFRVLQVPGAEFGAFRWGYTVDPPLPGLTDKPLVTRDLLPLGSAGAMDLLYALDNRLQEGTIEPASIAPVARLLAADTVLVANDTAFDRFRTPRPELVSALFQSRPPGLGRPVPYGEPEPNVPVLEVVDEQFVSDPRIGGALAPVELVPVEDPQPVVRATDHVVVVAGSGDGLVDAAAAGLIEGDEAIFYAADRRRMPTADDVLGDDTLVVVTDSNRDRATHWRGSQDVTGMTELGGPRPDVTREDDADERLAVFPDQDPNHQTTAALEGGLVVRGSAYGEPTAYRPEQRPAMAVDGDVRTSWVVADRGDPAGESLEVSTTEGRLVLLQPQSSRPTRLITRVRVDQPSRAPVELELTAASHVPPGQVVQVAPGERVTITIVEVGDRPGSDSGGSAVGFAEVGPVASELVHPPSDLLGTLPAEQPLAVVLSRERVRADNRWRSDPEPALAREIELGTARTFDLAVTLRLHGRAPDGVINALAGRVDGAVANRRLTGVVAAHGEAALDDDPSTAWTTPFGEAVGSAVEVPVDPATEVSTLTLSQPLDPFHSPITGVRVRIGATDAELDVPAPDADGRSTITFPPAAGSSLTLTITEVESRGTRDRRYGELVELPAAITELAGLDAARTIAAAPPPGRCRSDLLSIDGRPVALAVDQQVVDRLLAGQEVAVGRCRDAAAPGGASSTVTLAGRPRIVSALGVDTGIDVDRVVLTSGRAAGSEHAPTEVSVTRDGGTRTATVSPCPRGCWLILGEGFNPAWTARLTGGGAPAVDLRAPTQIGGGFNGWWLPPSVEQRTVRMAWPPQRTLDAALVATVLAVAACVALAIADRRRRTGVVVADPPTLRPVLHAAGTGAAVTSAAVLVVAAGLVVAPLWAAIALIPGAVVVLLRRPRVLGLAAATLAAVLGGIVIQRQLDQRFFLNAGWTSYFEDLHRPGLFVVVLLLASCIGSDCSAAGDAPETITPETITRSARATQRIHEVGITDDATTYDDAVGEGHLRRHAR